MNPHSPYSLQHQKISPNIGKRTDTCNNQDTSAVPSKHSQLAKQVVPAVPLLKQSTAQPERISSSKNDKRASNKKIKSPNSLMQAIAAKTSKRKADDNHVKMVIMLQKTSLCMIIRSTLITLPFSPYRQNILALIPLLSQRQFLIWNRLEKRLLKRILFALPLVCQARDYPQSKQCRNRKHHPTICHLANQ